MLDSISDMITRIRNANASRKEEVQLPYSKLRFAIAQLLVKEGWVEKLEIIEPLKVAHANKNIEEKFKQLKIILKYSNGQPFITAINRVSRPGQRIYVGKDKIRPVLNGFGMAVISTPKGLMTDKEAKQKQIGGEVFFEIW
ncbi:MAG: 30S ribosomal protein S8 [Candidatus Parcubacteria bacterium]|nr:30S ribosomal protein S8 [Candidatus Parcubacteria bacterium]